MTRASILVIDPDPAAAGAIERSIEGRARVEAAASLQQGLERLVGGEWAVVVVSLDLPAVDFPLVERLSASVTAGVLVSVARPDTRVILEASRHGAVGVVGRPLQAEELRPLLREVLPAAPEEIVPLPEAGADEEEVIVGASPAILSVFRTIGRVAQSPATVLILGESGTGKEMVARTIHANSDRARGPFVAINCAAIPENLLESELFGHEKGAFTGAITRKVGRFERAHGGTLLLDEIGDMSIALQSKILRALQEREIERLGGESRIPVDVRVVAATNKDLRAAIAAGEFREDLYFRLAVVTLELPRLAERGDDLELLAAHFAARFSAQYGRGLRGVARSVLTRLRAHHWPGNIRELKNVVERAVLLAHGPVLLPEHLPEEQLGPGGGPAPASAGGGYPPDLPLSEVERLHIQRVIAAVGGHYGNAASVLGIHRNTLTRKAREYGLGG